MPSLVSAKRGQNGRASSKDHKTTIVKEKALQTQSDHLLVLRSALRDDEGQAKNVLDQFSAISKYTKNGCNLSLEFHTNPLPYRMKRFVFNLSKKNLQAGYDQGYGWVDDEKKDELRDESARFIFIRDMGDEKKGEEENESDQPKYVGFCHFRFSLQGEVVEAMEGEPSLFVYEIELMSEYQRKGVGSYLMMILELIAKTHKMSFLMIPLVKGVESSRSFFCDKLKFQIDAEYGEDDVQMILTKSLKKKKTSSASASSTSLSPVAETKESVDDAKKKKKKKKKKNKKKKKTSQEICTGENSVATYANDDGVQQKGDDASLKPVRLTDLEDMVEQSEAKGSTMAQILKCYQGVRAV